MSRPLDGVAFAGCAPGSGAPQVEVDLTETVAKLCDLVDILIGTDPDGDGILNVEIDGDLAVDCFVVPEQYDACLDGCCISATRYLKISKSGAFPTEVIHDTLPEGATVGPCPNIVEVSLPVSCCDCRVVLDTADTHDIPTLLELGPGFTVSDFTLTVQNVGDEGAPPVVVDCKGNESTLCCSESITLTGGCADETSTFQSVATSAGDVITIEARVCPPSEA